jgi:hypothetical protein
LIPGKLKCGLCRNTCFVGVGIFVVTFLKKWIALPYLKFLNSKIKTPPRRLMDQELSLPAPLPIRIPLDFFVSGMCGKVLNQIRRFVMSGFFTALLRNTFNRKICLADIRSGCSANNPQSPYVNCEPAQDRTERFFCQLLCLNFLGCNIKLTQKLKVEGV